MGAVTYIDAGRNARTMRLDLIERYGCSGELALRLQYTFDKVENMLKVQKWKKNIMIIILSIFYHYSKNERDTCIIFLYDFELKIIKLGNSSPTSFNAMKLVILI